MVSALVSRYPVEAQASSELAPVRCCQPWLQPYKSWKRWSTWLRVLTELHAKLDVLAKKVDCPSGWQGLTEDSGSDRGWFGVQRVSSWMWGPHGKCSPGTRAGSAANGGCEAVLCAGLDANPEIL